MITSAEPASVEAPPSRASEPRRRRVLHVVAPAPIGGLESVLRTLAEGQRDRAYDVRVACVVARHTRAHPFVDALRSANVPVHVLRLGGRAYVAERRAIARLCRSLLPDVLHTHGFRPDVVDAGVARSLGIATVSTCHGFIEGTLRGRVYVRVQLRALRRHDAVVAVSAPIAERLLRAGIPSARLHLAANGFAARADLLRREAAREELRLPAGVVVGWVGRLSREKGADVALDALAHSEGRWSIAVVGDGPEEARLRARAAALGIADRVIWCGRVPDAARAMRAFDAFLLSSRSEGTPMALLEAMAAELPVIATNVGGIPAILDERSASLVPSEDAIALAAAVDGAISDERSASARTRTARRILDDRFGIGSWLDRYDHVYQTAIAHRRGVVRAAT